MHLPDVSTVLWRVQTKWTIALAPPLGSITMMVSWLRSAHVVVDVSDDPILNNTVPFGTGVIYSIILTYLLGLQNFNWEILETGVRVIDDNYVTEVTEKQLQQQLAVKHLSPLAEWALYRGKIINSFMALGHVTVTVTSRSSLAPGGHSVTCTAPGMHITKCSMQESP